MQGCHCYVMWYQPFLILSQMHVWWQCNICNKKIHTKFEEAIYSAQNFDCETAWNLWGWCTQLYFILHWYASNVSVLILPAYLTLTILALIFHEIVTSGLSLSVLICRFFCPAFLSKFQKPVLSFNTSIYISLFDFCCIICFYMYFGDIPGTDFIWSCSSVQH